MHVCQLTAIQPSNMKAIYLSLGLAALAAAAPDPLITPAPELAPRQNDPALLGWISVSNGQFSDQRSCDYPATLSSSGSLAQCCASSSCNFWQSCSAGTLFAQQTSLRCDQGFCNTAVIISTTGVTSGQSYLGCWATSLGSSPFTIVKDIGSASVVAASGAKSSANSDGASNTPASTSSSSGATQTSASSSSHSNAAAAIDPSKPLTGALGLLAVFMALL